MTTTPRERSTVKRSRAGGDASQRAWAVVQVATGQAEPDPVKDPVAVSRGRAGGIARAEKLTAERRREIAQSAVAARKRSAR